MPTSDVLLVMGPPGSGKTSLAVQMAFHAAKIGLNVLYVSTYSEPPTRLLRHARAFSFYDESQIGKRFVLQSLYPLVRNELGTLVDALVNAVQRHEAKLVVIDSLTTIRDLQPDRFATRTLLYELGTTLSQLGCTLVFTRSQEKDLAADSSPEFTRGVTYAIVHTRQKADTRARLRVWASAVQRT